MINTYIINGDIKITYQSLIELLKDMLDASKVRDRYAADIQKVIHYEDNGLDIYVEEHEEDWFFFSAEYKESLEVVENFMETFKVKLDDSSVSPYHFHWSEVDEDEEIVGEQYEFSN